MSERRYIVRFYVSHKQVRSELGIAGLPVTRKNIRFYLDSVADGCEDQSTALLGGGIDESDVQHYPDPPRKEAAPCSTSTTSR